jgi:signal transduction histidine kinase
MGILVAVSCVVAETLLTDLLQQITPVRFLGIMYLLGVVLVASVWGVWLGMATAMVSTIVLDYFFIPPIGSLIPVKAADWTVLTVFVALTLTAWLISKLARSLDVEVDARAEADLAADLARILLHAPDVKTAQPAAARHLARVLKLPSAVIQLGAVPDDKQQMAFPLHERGVPVGSLLVPTGLPRPTLRRLRDRVVPSMEVLLQAARERERVAEEQVALRRLATLVARGAPPDEIFGAVAGEVAQILEARYAAVFRYEPDATVTVVGVWNSDRVATMPFGSRWPLEKGIVVELVARTKAPGRIDDIQATVGTGELLTWMRDLGVNCVVGCPVTVGGRLWGAVVATSTSEPLPEDTEKRMLDFTELVATAIANADSHAKLSRSLATEIEARAEADLSAGLARILLRAPDVKTAQPAAARHLARALELPSAEIRLGAIPDDEQQVAFPLHDEGIRIGSLRVPAGLPRLTLRRLRDRVVPSLEVLLQAARERQRIMDEQVALRRLATLVARGAPPGEVFGAVAREVGQILEVRHAVVARYEPDATVTAVGGWNSDRVVTFPLGSRWPLEKGTVAELVARTKAPGRIDAYDASLGAGELLTVVRDMGLTSAVGCPVTVGGRLWGAVVAGSASGPLPEDTEKRLLDFTDLVATAIANADSHAKLSRSLATEIEARAEADLSAELARILLRAPDVKTAQPAAARHLARALELPSAEIQLGAIPDDEHQVAFPLHEHGVPVGSVLVPAGLPRPTLRRLRDRVVPSMEVLLQAARERQRITDEQAALRRLATLVARGAPPDEIFAAVAREVGHILQVRHTAVFRYEPDATVTMVGVWNSGRVATVPLGSRWPLEKGTIGELVARTKAPGRIDDIQTTVGTGPILAIYHDLGINCLVACPITVGGCVWGAVVAGSTSGPLPEDTEKRMIDFTDLVATAIANADSHAKLQASRARVLAAADATRRLIERDLHDGTQQRLVALLLELRDMETMVPPELEELRGGLSHTTQALDEALEDLRGIARGLHPALLSRRGLKPAIKALARCSPIPVELNMRSDQRLAERYEVTTYHIVSEALTNAAKHADASTVHVDLIVENATIRLWIRDDGKGRADPDRGSGLLSITDRVEALGGRLLITSPVGGGTSLLAEIPIADD